ncbi:ankyrin [Colletotrichum eremochloae]|nr:ankyrin [Colletotrichum eremochloae]
MARLLLANGVDATAVDKSGWTPLHVASFKGQVELAEFFLKRCPHHIEVQDDVGRTPVFLEAIQGRAETVRFLLSQKASAHVQDFYNATPLIAASRHGHESVVELLLQAQNICLEHKDDFGLTALSWARKSGNAHTLQLLLGNSDKEDVQINGEDALTRKEAISFHEDWAYCDVCTICIPGGKAHHRCEVCFGGGDFCICSECYAAGMKCLDGSHKWTPWGGD